MKPIIMDQEAEEKVLRSFLEKFKKQWEDFKLNMNDTKFSFSATISEEAKDKVTVMFTPKAYLRMQALVDYFDTEVGWYGLVERLADKIFRVYDVKICKQYVNGGKVDTKDDENDNEVLKFFDSLTDEEANHMHFQAHSHVKMTTNASGIDLQNQTDVIRNMGKTGFYIFQIWNKNGDINTYLYDLDNNVFYDKKDVVIEIEDDEGTLMDYIASIQDLVVEKKTYPYQENKRKKKEEKEETVYLNNYWNGVNYPERWDW